MLSITGNVLVLQWCCYPIPLGCSTVNQSEPSHQPFAYASRGLIIFAILPNVYPSELHTTQTAEDVKS